MKLRMPQIMDIEALIDLAFRRAAKESSTLTIKGVPKLIRTRKREERKVKVVAYTIKKRLEKVLTKSPRVEELPLFYQELVEVVIGKDKLKKSFGAVRWALNKIENLEEYYRYKIRTSKTENEIFKYRREFYGRVRSILKQIEDEVNFLRETSKKLRRFPVVKESFTIVIAGMPNVGKSTFLRAITTSKPKVESYPFTTKQILLGYFEKGYEEYQVVDTPGLLDRTLEERNPIEKQAILALKHLADVILFIFDITETCGFTQEEQLKIFNEISSLFDIRVIPIVNKSDILNREKIKEFEKKIGKKIFVCSALKKEGIEDIIEGAIEQKAEQ